MKPRPLAQDRPPPQLVTIPAKPCDSVRTRAAPHFEPQVRRFLRRVWGVGSDPLRTLVQPHHAGVDAHRRATRTNRGCGSVGQTAFATLTSHREHGCSLRSCGPARSSPLSRRYHSRELQQARGPDSMSAVLRVAEPARERSLGRLGVFRHHQASCGRDSVEDRRSRCRTSSIGWGVRLRSTCREPSL